MSVPAPAPRRDGLVAALLAAVASHRTRRVPLQVLRAAHARHDPTGASDAGARARLAAAVDVLVEDGVVRVPRAKRLFESHAQPPLPVWVERPSAPAPGPRPARPRVWRPDLAAAGALASTASEFATVDAVEVFLRDGGAGRPLVPHRERSVELFGNEKRLDGLLHTRLFTSGALSLDLLRCYVVPLPLTAQYAGRADVGGDLLIVENHATYASALRVARERAEGAPVSVAVGFGSGQQLPAAVGGVALLDPVPARLWYFGDLDAAGLRIAAAADVAAREAGLGPLRPAVPLYRELLSVGVRQQGQPVVDAAAAAELASWLPGSLADGAAEVLTSGTRVAQESVGYEVLSSLSTWW